MWQPNVRRSHRSNDGEKRRHQLRQLQDDQVPILREDSQLSRRWRRVSSRSEYSAVIDHEVLHRTRCGQEEFQLGHTAPREVDHTRQRGLRDRLLRASGGGHLAREGGQHTEAECLLPGASGQRARAQDQVSPQPGDERDTGESIGCNQASAGRPQRPTEESLDFLLKTLDGDDAKWKHIQSECKALLEMIKPLGEELNNKIVGDPSIQFMPGTSDTIGSI